MIREWLAYLTTPVDRQVRRMGFLTECVAIEARYRRHAAAWSGHQRRTKQAITAAIADCDQKRRVVVFGAALVLDLPLAALAEAFQDVILVDVLFMRASRQQAAAFDNVSLLVHDLTQSLTKIEAGIPEVAAPDRFLDDASIDLVLSVNVLSQLAIIPNVYLNRHFGADERRDVAVGQALVQRHVDYLQQFTCEVLLVTDVERIIEDRAGFEVARMSAVFDVSLPSADDEWDWSIAPYGEIDHLHQVRHRIRACRWGPDGGKSIAGFPSTDLHDMPLIVEGVARNVAETTKLAHDLAACLTAGDVVALEGDLGAGKSTFARALIQSLGLHGTDVPSPTFTLVQTYSGQQDGLAGDAATPIEIAHFDCFRLDDGFEAEELGLEDLMSDHLCLIEWPQRVAAYLPANCLYLSFSVLALDQRRISMSGDADWADGLAFITIGGGADEQ